MILVPVVIDGETQPGASCPTAATPADLMIIIDGGNTTAITPGLLLFTGTSGSTLCGLVIGNFPSTGLSVGSDENRIFCNHIGLGVDGTTGIGNGSHGAEVTGNNSIIGGLLSASQWAVISGNTIISVYLYPNAGNTLVAKNFVGKTAATG